MRVLFYQPSHTGHHFAYLARMMPGFIDLPIERVVATTPAALRSEEFAKTLQPISQHLDFVTSCTPAPRSPIQNARHRLRELLSAIHAIRPDHVAVCYADGLWDQAYLSTLVGRRPWPRDLVVEAWIYRGRFGDSDDRRWKSILRRRMFCDMLRRAVFRKLHLHHELLYEFAPVATPTAVVLAPDPIIIKPPMSSEDARREFGLPAEGKWVGTCGMIARFKGSDLLLRAFRHRCEQLAEPPMRLFLAGPHEDSILAILGEEPYRSWVAEGRIVSLDRFLDEGEMYAAAAAVDAVVAPYPSHQNRSSIMLWSAAAGRPCIAAGESNVGYVLRKEGLGMACDVRDPAALAAAMTNVLNAPWNDDDMARVRRYAEFHRIENYQHLSSQLVRERLATTAPSVEPVRVE